MKSGTVREDGKIYHKYNKLKGVWLTPDEYHRRKEHKRNYQRNAFKAYRKRNPIPKKVGQYSEEKKLYFYGLTGSGKEVWKTYEFIIKKRQQQKIWRQKYLTKCKSMPKSDQNVGDRHPYIHNLYVIRKIGNKVFYGKHQKLIKIKEGYKRQFQKRNERYKAKRSLITNKLSKGHVCPKIGRAHV